MKYTITGRNVDITPKVKGMVEKSLGKLDKFFSKETEVIVTLTDEAGRKTAEVTIPVKGTIIRTEQVSDDLFVTIDLASEVIERQLKRHKEKLTDRYQAAGIDFSALAEDFEPEEDEIRIVRTKSFAIKPMDPEEACMQMDLIGHSFFVFLNADTDTVNVVYKRKGGTYGLIEPEIC